MGKTLGRASISVTRTLSASSVTTWIITTRRSNESGALCTWVPALQVLANEIVQFTTLQNKANQLEHIVTDQTYALTSSTPVGPPPTTTTGKLASQREGGRTAAKGLSDSCVVTYQRQPETWDSRPPWLPTQYLRSWSEWWKDIGSVESVQSIRFVRSCDDSKNGTTASRQVQTHFVRIFQLLHEARVLLDSRDVECLRLGTDGIHEVIILDASGSLRSLDGGIICMSCQSTAALISNS